MLFVYLDSPHSSEGLVGLQRKISCPCGQVCPLLCFVRSLTLNRWICHSWAMVVVFFGCSSQFIPQLTSGVAAYNKIHSAVLSRFLGPDSPNETCLDSFDRRLLQEQCKPDMKKTRSASSLANI